jgi:hypothetical protein
MVTARSCRGANHALDMDSTEVAVSLSGSELEAGTEWLSLIAYKAGAVRGVGRTRRELRDLGKGRIGPEGRSSSSRTRIRPPSEVTRLDTHFRASDAAVVCRHAAEDRGAAVASG